MLHGWSGHSFQWSQEGLDALAVEMKTKTVELEQATVYSGGHLASLDISVA